MRRPSLSYANVTATLALILALGGTSYAAVTIDGADIKRKSIPLNRLKGKPPTGARGPIGPQGLAGASGAPGAAGLAGSKGDAGPTGEAGIRGPKGENGTDGLQGSSGSQGLQGPQGPAGSTGPQGPTGAPGPKGSTGAQGPDGPQGIKGDTGSQGPPGLIGDAVFDGGPLSDQLQGVDSAVLTATGLAAGSYLVSYRLDVAPAQRYTCAVASGTLLGPTTVLSSRTTSSGTDPETLASTGVVTILQAGQDQILTCNGASSDWSVDSSELHFLRVDQVSDGVEG
jgi:hypothetical protein